MNKEELLKNLPESIALIIPSEELNAKDLKLINKLYQSKDVVKMLDHERTILEWFMKCSFHGYLATIGGSSHQAEEQQQLTLI